MTLKELQRDWEDLGEMDPLFAILTDPSRKNGKWDIGDFFRSGEREIEGVMAATQQLSHPLEWQIALDFGCGVGRLTRALSVHFQQCYGIDISASMIAQAAKLNVALPACTFAVNSEANLAIFPGDHFDLVYSNLVLQHIPDKAIITAYVSEFVRVLKPGGLLAFQVPSSVPFWHSRIKPRATAYRLLNVLRCDKRFVYERLNVYPITMTAVPRQEVLAHLRAANAQVLDVRPPDMTYYVTK